MPRRWTGIQESRDYASRVDHQRRAESEERQLNDFQNLSFRGAAVVRLSDLSAGDGWCCLEDDSDNTFRIEQILKAQGCLRLNKRYHVPILVDESSWQSEAFFEDRTLVPALDLPQLGTSENYNFTALDQRSLIIAAKNYFQKLQSPQSWWIVDLYMTEASKSCAK